MHGKQFALVLALATSPAMAGFESMMNPMVMMNPITMMVPMTMMAAPMGMMNPVGMMNPMTMAVPMMGMGGAMQMAPNMMSFSHQNQMANPFLGGPAGGNPYLQPSGFMGMPFPMAPQPQAAPSMFPFMSQTPAQATPGTAYYPAMPQAAASAQPSPVAMPFDPMMFMNMLALPAAPVAPAPAK